MTVGELEPSRRRLRLSAIVLASVVVVSSIGYYILGGADRSIVHSLYLTANVFSTVGGWSEPLNTAQQIWTILMIMFGIGGAMFAFSSVMAVMTSGQIRSMLGRRQLTGKIDSLNDHYIICGFGRMGRNVCYSLAEAKRPFVLIDLESTRTAAAGEMGYLYLLGDASDERVLHRAGIDRARGLVTCLPHDADNVFVTLTARGMNDAINIIARAEAEATEKRLMRCGADRVITPSVIGAHKITRMLLNPAVEDMIDAAASADFAVERVTLRQAPKLVGRSLKDLALPKQHGLMVLAVERADGTRLFNPPADHILSEDEQMILVGPAGAIDRMINHPSPAPH